MKRRTGPRKSRQRVSLNGLMITFVIAILINAGLITASAYMLILRTGVMRPLIQSTVWPLLCVLTCILLAITLSAGFGQRMLKPLRDVNRAMKKVAKGDFSQRVSVSGQSDEIAELVESYNNMAAELNGIEIFRTDFINNFSHEFKTPIVSIRGFAKQLERDDLTDEQRREYTQIIVSESERLANMSANVLLLSRLESQQIVTDQAEYALDEQLRACVLLLEKQWEDKNLELKLDLDALKYFGNEELLAHVWVNLIGNAIKFSPVGSALELSCMRVQNFIVVCVRDHGCGMDADTQARVFEKFYQGDTAHATEGNGLGLPLARRIVELSGGKITVDSTPGEGSAFSVYLPVKEPDEGA